MTTKTTISNTDDLIDIRDVIERFEELESAHEDNAPFGLPDDEALEFRTLGDLIEACEGNGGDEQWRGDWYPVTLIRDSYFTDYAMDLLDDIGVLPADTPWYVEIDREATAKNVQVDYTSVEFDGVTYWIR